VTAAATPQTSTGEAVAFWILAPLAVFGALGMLLARKAVHSALLLAVTMVSLALLYMAQNAPFLGIVQIVVYTGAVMMLFLFVLMLVGVDASDSLVETLRGQRLWGVLFALGFAGLLIGGISRASFPDNDRLASANADGNVEGIAAVLFSRYVLAFEVTSALLITAALGAMVLAHREQHEPRKTQRQMSEERVRLNKHLPPLPSSGIYARHNAVDTPGLLPDGSPAELSVSRRLRERGAVRSLPTLVQDAPAVDRAVGTARTRQAVTEHEDPPLHLPADGTDGGTRSTDGSDHTVEGEEPRR